jgi:hypothetical protein
MVTRASQASQNLHLPSPRSSYCPAMRRIVLLVVLLLGIASAAGLWYGERPPRPDLPLPSGWSLVSVKGHCLEGSELFMCQAGDRPRSTLVIAVTGRASGAFDELSEFLSTRGWRSTYGELCKKKQGCLEQASAAGDGVLVLDWYDDH